ncbi:hypothetical protein SDRG_09069 [Saprolegnia diclina VS20]|uniref:Nucleolar protein 16 n=1 Tax=Saprolegnia diclina (strain VS20) TaxID=1156394 RepID=T0RML6_SAPDV|nr:hypothetical protein SDRG_09069 [Saprolegnia diclina VS20]EQC33563.1 hypothetical protein SDRG_09069 [Saprolegnia diclina VS20]|eukprot:XP_008613203.1 hypothetical protein SDRG_09069 [Saprolegnia diclina VS20]
MVHARNRPGKGKVKVSRKSKPIRKYKTKFVGDGEIKKLWDHKLTTKQNYEKIGLNRDPNAIAQIRACTEEIIDPEELFDVPDSDILNLNDERNHKKAENHMSEMEVAYLRPLLAKFGDDYAAMARDIKINNEQWTESKLKRRCARLKLVDAKIIK